MYNFIIFENLDTNRHQFIVHVSRGIRLTVQFMFLCYVRHCVDIVQNINIYTFYIGQD